MRRSQNVTRERIVPLELPESVQLREARRPEFPGKDRTDQYPGAGVRRRGPDALHHRPDCWLTLLGDSDELAESDLFAHYVGAEAGLVS